MHFKTTCSDLCPFIAARDLTTAKGLAFEKTVEKLKAAFPSIANLNDNGTESQV